MKYLLSDQEGVIKFDEYFKYIESISSLLSVDIYEYAKNYEHYNLTSHASLHDSWLEHFEIKENSSGENNEIRNTKIELCFLGAFHDRYLYIEYANVTAYSVTAKGVSSGHGDLNVHEFGISDNGIPYHELCFVDGSVFYIEFDKFNYREQNTR